MSEPTPKDLPGSGLEAPEPVGAGDSPGAVAMAPAFDLAAAIDRYQTPLLHYVRRYLCGQTDQAQDVVQEAFLRLHRQVSSNGTGSIDHLASWLFRVAHNLAQDAGRRQRRRDKLRQNVADRARAQRASHDRAPGPLGAMAQREAQDRAVAELANLPPPMRQVVLLKVAHGMSLRQISKVTGTSVGSAGYQLNKALAQLARRLKEAKVI